MEVHTLSNEEECDGGRLFSPRAGMGGSEESLVGFHGGPIEGGRDARSDLGVLVSDNTNGVSSHVANCASRGEATVRDGDLDRMELEGGGEGTPTC